MSTTFPQPDRGERLHNLALRPRAAKVHTSSHKKVANTEYRTWLGRCLERAVALSELTNDQFASEVGCHSTQLSKWIRNAEPPQTDRVLASTMRGFLLQAMAASTPGCRVVTQITFERIA